MHNYTHVGFGRGLKSPIVEQINGKGPRYYLTEDGQKYPSITSILSENPDKKESIGIWENKVGIEQARIIKEEAARRGTLIHLRAEHYINNLPDKAKEVVLTNPIYIDMWNNMVPVLHRINNVHCQEQRMYSHHLRTAGTVDCIGEFDGRLSVIDFKTSSKIKKIEWIEDYFMQCAAYAIMYEELTQIPIDTLAVIIAVENEDTQVFVEKRDTWAPKLIKQRDYYERVQKVKIYTEGVGSGSGVWQSA